MSGYHRHYYAEAPDDDAPGPITVMFLESVNAPGPQVSAAQGIVGSIRHALVARRRGKAKPGFALVAHRLRALAG